MPLDKPGSRRRAVASKDIQHGTFTVENKFVGLASKTKQATRYTAPDAAAIKTIANGEVFTMFCSGVHEVARAAGIDTGVVGDRVWITPGTGALKLDAASAAGDYPVGVIDSIDTVRDTCLINMDNHAAFLVKA